MLSSLPKRKERKYRRACSEVLSEKALLRSFQVFLRKHNDYKLTDIELRRECFLGKFAISSKHLLFEIPVNSYFRRSSSKLMLLLVETCQL